MIFGRLRKKNRNGDARAKAGPSIVSSDVVIDGSLTTAGELQIDGTINGAVRAHSCVVDVQGVVQGEIIAEEVYVRGRVIGPIYGKHVHLHAGGHVEGDIFNESVSVEHGAYVYGAIRRSDDPLGMREAGPKDNPRFPQLKMEQDNDGFRPLRAVRPR